jgi:two-component system OmpR family response regulator
MPKSILVVDDEPAVSAALVDYFRNQGHVVDAAEELEEAGALLAFRRYDAAILDLRLTSLGGSEGLSLLHEIRERDSRMTVLLMSAYVAPEARRQALQHGADGVLQKPFPLSELERLTLASPRPVHA